MPATKTDDQRRDQIKQIIALSGSASYLGPIARAVVAYRDQILGAMFADPRPTAGTISGIISDAKERLTQLVTASSEGLAKTVVEMNDDSLRANLDLDMAFAASGVPLDSFGHPLPAASMPGDITWEEDDPEKVFLWIASLLVLNGEFFQERETPLIREIRGEVDPAKYATNSRFSTRTDNALKKQDQVGFKTRAKRMVESAMGGGFAAAVANQFRKGKSASAIRSFVSNRLGIGSQRTPGSLGTDGGLLRGLEIVMREKAIQMLEEDRQRDYEEIPKSLLEGYELRSVFAETTRPSHAARDGWKFYRDNRPGSALPWKERLIPPYAWNCLCFTRQIWGFAEPYVPWSATPRFKGAHIVKPQDVGGWYFEKGKFRQIISEDVGRRLGRENTPSLLVRDIGTYQTWFDTQSIRVKTSIMGEGRVAALRANGIQVPKYKDFVNPDGSFLSARVLAQEGRSTRRTRKRKVSRAMNRQLRLQRESLKTGKSRFKLSGEDEEAYRKRLELFLRRTMK